MKNTWVSRILSPATWLAFSAFLNASPFFAMDTGISGQPVAVAATLHDLGYDGLGGSGTNIRPAREALDARKLRLWNVYLTLKFEAGAPAVTPGLRTLITDLKGHSSTLWIAVQAVSGGGDQVAVAALREIAGVAAESEVRVSLYPHTGFWLSRFSGAADLAEKVERENVGITFNLCHWLKVEGDVDPIPDIRKHQKKLQFVTVNGADKGDTKAMSWDRLIQPLDRGTYDTASFLKRLNDEAKWQGPVGLQSFGIPGDQRENLKRSMVAWRAMQSKPG
jgi:sugar phosphate isomerase/epimerase